jgi:hypothetical protein
VYRVRPWVVLPVFVVVFVCLRLALLLLPSAEEDPGGRLVLLLLVQAVGPAFAGSLLFAWLTAMLDDRPELGGQPPGARPWLGTVLAAAGISALLALVLVVLLGGAGLLLQPALYGPPVVLPAIVLERKSLGAAWVRAKAVLKRDARIPAYVLVGVGLAGLVALAALAAAVTLAAGRDQAQLAVQGIALGLTLPYVAAVGLAAFERVAGADPTPGAPGLRS